MDLISFRAARGEEAGLLSELALRSKAHWGYDQAFLAACRAELTFEPAEVAARRFVVAESPRAGVVGFYGIDGEPPDGEIGNLWVAPDHIGTGLGRRLWEHAVAEAEAEGFTSLRIEADPNAAGFYQAMGAVQVGEAPSASIGGRMLPLLKVTLASR